MVLSILWEIPLAPALVVLVDAYATNDIAAAIKACGDQLRREEVRQITEMLLVVL